MNRYIRRNILPWALVIIFLLAPSVGYLIVHAETTYTPVYSKDSSGFKRLLVYYGWLNTGNLENLNIDLLVLTGGERILQGGEDYGVLGSLRSSGVMVFAYLHDLNGGDPGTAPDGDTSNDSPIGLGSSFKTMVFSNTTGSLDERYNYWLSYLESAVDNYAGIVDGVFLDECDPSYFTSDFTGDKTYIDKFTQGIQSLVAYAHKKGLLVFVNGVMHYANYGDYYLWEDFIDTYDNGYILLNDFLASQSYSSDLEWVNGLSRYYYLRDNGLLGKTIAVTFIDPNHPETEEWGRAAYFLARIMGLGGWGYADYKYYSSGGSVPVGIASAYETGIPVGDPSIGEGYAWRFFLGCGNASVTVGSTGVSLELDPGYLFPTTRVVVDGVNNSEYSNLLPQKVSGDYSTLNSVGAVNTVTKLYFYSSWSYDSQASSGGLLHLYLDTDGSSSTGYSIYGIGADYMVEVSTDGNGILYEYTGSGSDWSWNQVGSVNTIVKNDGLSYQSELSIDKSQLQGLDDSTAEFVVYTIYNWGDDAGLGATNLPELRVTTPTFYESSTGYDAYTGVVVSSALSNGRLVVLSKGPSGRIVNYTLIAPFTVIEDVLINGSALQKGIGGDGTGYVVKKTWDGYSEIMVLAQHHSPINITITGTSEPRPIPEPYYLGPVILLVAVSVFLALTRTL